jgi:hypothetical protein
LSTTLMASFSSHTCAKELPTMVMGIAMKSTPHRMITALFKARRNRVSSRQTYLGRASPGFEPCAAYVMAWPAGVAGTTSP